MLGRSIREKSLGTKLKRPSDMRVQQDELHETEQKSGPNVGNTPLDVISELLLFSSHSDAITSDTGKPARAYDTAGASTCAFDRTGRRECHGGC